jgi:hypothetical protein
MERRTPLSTNPPQGTQNATLQIVLNSIILRESGMWQRATDSIPQNFIAILESAARMETCTEIASRLGIVVIDAMTDSEGKTIDE